MAGSEWGSPDDRWRSRPSSGASHHASHRSFAWFCLVWKWPRAADSTVADSLCPLGRLELRSDISEETMRRRDFVIGGAAAFTSVASVSPIGAQGAYPMQQIHLAAPAPAGGVQDVSGRIWADRVKSALGAIVIENRAGGGSSIALNYVVQQPADGHLLLVGSTSTLVLREGGNNRAYDALKDIRSAAVIATTSTSIAVHPALPVKSIKELIAYAK